MTKHDNQFMAQALKLARLSGRAVAPNPMVGAVIVKDGRVIGKGYHQKFGGPHAEVLAIQSVKNKKELQWATMYVTLEPCRHQGKTPPCWELIQSVEISRVICGSQDPYQKKFQIPSTKFQTKSQIPNLPAGRQGSKLNPKFQIPNFEKPIVQFLMGRLAKECRELNKFFFTRIQKKRPYITVKIAISADGFVAGEGGKEVHFTSKKQDQLVHQLRADHQAIMVGSQTVLRDDPHLGVRHVEGEDPLRIILDSMHRIPKTAQVFRDQNFLHIKKRTPLKTLFAALAQQGIASILVEPGPTLYQLLKKQNLIDELIILKGRRKLGEGLKINL